MNTAGLGHFLGHQNGDRRDVTACGRDVSCVPVQLHGMIGRVQPWLKALYNAAGRADAADWTSMSWVSDGTPGRRPGYRVGDELLLYDVPRRQFPARARVLSEAREDPEFVNTHGGPGEGSRWPWVTEIEVLGAADRAVAPTALMLSQITITQGGHWRISADDYAAATALLPNGFEAADLDSPLARPVPIERETTEPFEQRFEAATRTAYRREQALVGRLDRHLRRQGHSVSRHAITLPGGTVVYSDLYDHTTGLLVEAKASTQRASIRMAIGQLADYARGMDPRPKARAVLVPERPSGDLVNLLDELDIAVIWETKAGFADNHDGEWL